MAASDDKRTGPVLIETEEAGPSPAEVAPVPGPEEATTGRAMQTMAVLATRRTSWLTAVFWPLLVALVSLVVSVAVWDFVAALMARAPVLGTAALVLTFIFLAVCSLIALREWAALARLGRLEALHRDAASARAANNLGAARKVVRRIEKLYATREELRWGRERLTEREAEVFDADTLFDLAETELLAPIDLAARREVEAASRQVATVTALVPLALADVFAAMTANLRMIRRIAELYGGRGGTLGSWRLTRAVFAHLVATGAVAVGDDMLGSVAGGGVLSKLSRRFGEGLINGALTARVGIAAIEVCRPLPFQAQKRPSVTQLVSSALAGLFGTGQAKS